MSDERVGLDESGKGDYFGPLVIAACYVGPEHLAELEDVRESKKVTDKKALDLAKRIKAACPHKVLTINPPKYNELYAKIGNLNRLLAWGHATALEDVLEQVPNCPLAISDQFAKPDTVKRRLKERGQKIELISVVRAESDLAVAAASILARAEFLWRLRALGQEIGVDLPKGAGPPVKSAAIRLAKDQGMEVFKSVAKLHFKTTEQVRRAAEA